MKNIRKILVFTLLLTALFSFNSFAMKNEKDLRQTPLNEKEHDNSISNYRWTWLSDEACVRFDLSENTKRETIVRKYNCGYLPQWAKNGAPNKANVITRDTYSGKWSQSEDGTWSFTFDDCTIPVGVTKIDNKLYAFNTYGELKVGYEYYDGFKTDADGLVKADSEEFTKWLDTQYLPDCTSHE